MTLPMPVKIKDVSYAFPADALDYMPKWEDIPDEFKDRSPWCDIPDMWVSTGLSSRFSFQPATIDGEKVDAFMAWRQIDAIMRSFAPKHEHKVAAIAYLCSLWMESVIFGPAGCLDSELHVLGEASLDEWMEYFAEQEKAANA